MSQPEERRKFSTNGNLAMLLIAIAFFVCVGCYNGYTARVLAVDGVTTEAKVIDVEDGAKAGGRVVVEFKTRSGMVTADCESCPTSEFVTGDVVQNRYNPDSPRTTVEQAGRTSHLWLAIVAAIAAVGLSAVAFIVARNLLNE